MKAISYLNLLTAVVIFLTGGFAGAQAAGTVAFAHSQKTKEACEAACQRITEFPAACQAEPTPPKADAKGDISPGNATLYQTSLSQYSTCQTNAKNACSAACGDKDAKSDTSATCKAAFDDWKKVDAEGKKACLAFTGKKSEQSCQDRVADCKKEVDKISKLVLPDGTGTASDDRGRITDIVRVLAQTQGYTATGNLTPGATVGGQNAVASCVKFDNDRITKAQEKQERKLEKIDEDIKKLKDKISEKKKKIAEEDEKLRKENNTIDEDIEKLKKELAEDKLKITEKARKSWEAANKQAQESAAQVRTLNAVIIKRKGDLERLRYEQNENMLQFAEGKVKDRCEQALQIARDCFQKAARGEKFGEKDQCAGFSGPGRGLKGTANLNKKLKQVETACYEQADLASRKAKFNFSQQVADMERDIAEKTAQVSDLNRAAIQARESYEKITKESQTEQANADTSASTRESNFKKKLADVQQSVEESKTLMNNEIKEHELQIQELVARKLPGQLGIVPNSTGEDVRLMHSEAAAAISEEEKKRSIAFTSCKCEEDPTSMKSYCSPLKKAEAEVKRGYKPGDSTK